jgi:calcineurin-like phosphoesterase family protein
MLKPLKLPTSLDHTWVVSDTHWHHDRPWIVQARGFTSVEEHDETLIARWNERVGPEDVVLHLGDFMAQSDAAGFWAIVRRLTFAQLYICLGNHLSGHKQAYTEAVQRRFADLDNLDDTIAAEVYPLTDSVDGDPAKTVTFLPEYVEISVAKTQFVLCHYALTSWHHMGRGNPMLHGHSHGSLTEKLNRRRDVGIECYGGPVSLAQLLREMEGEEPAKVDHH